MSTKVYFAPARARRWDYSASQIAGLERLIEKMGLGSGIAKDDYVAIKTHFGSEGAHRIVRPRFLRVLVEAVKAVGGKPFVCDTVRIQGWDYLEVANQHAINPQSVGCPVINAEYPPCVLWCSRSMRDMVQLLMSGKIACQSGYGGAIKNLAIGSVAGRHRGGD